jgi:hypothetical protein
MPDPTIQDIEQIRGDIIKQEISFSHLLDELIDHVCCDVENEMLNGLTFSEAYRNVRQKIGPDRFSDIQKETLYEVDSKYRKMKKTMKISGIAGTILFGLAALFKIQHWPLAGIMMTLGALILSFVFLPSSLGVLWKETHNRKRIFLFVAAFLMGFFFIMGTLFKVMHWPGASFIFVISALAMLLLFIPSLIGAIFSDPDNKSFRAVYLTAAVGFMLLTMGMIFKIQHWPLATLLTLAGVIILGFISMPWYTRLRWKDEIHVNPVFIFLVISSLLIIVPVALVNVNLQTSYEDGFYFNQTQQQAMNDYMIMHNTSLISMNHDTLTARSFEMLHMETLKLSKLIGSIKSKMVQESEGEPGKPAISSAQLRQTETGTMINYKLLSRPFHNFVSRQLLPDHDSRLLLEESINQYYDFVCTLVHEGQERYGHILNPKVYFPADTELPVNFSMMSGLHALELLGNSILIVESDIIRSLTSSQNPESLVLSTK